MSYQPGIPTGLVNLDTDYQNIQGNFQALDTVFGIDHTLFSNATGQKGYHTSIHLIPQSTPAATAGYGQIFSDTVNDGVNTDQILYYLTGGNRLIQLTRNFTPVVPADATISNTGTTFLPGGLILKWGRSAGSIDGVVNIAFTASFPNNFFWAGATFQDSSGSSSTRAIYTQTAPTNGAVTNINFYIVNGGGKPFYWLALGN